MADRRDIDDSYMQSGWEGPGIEIWPEEDDYIMWRSMKEDAKRHGVQVLNPDVNRSFASCAVEDETIRLGFLNVRGLGTTTAEEIETARLKGDFSGIGDFLERSGVLEETAFNLAGAGAFDSLEKNRRKVKWEIGLRYRPVNRQLPLSLPIAQDMVDLNAPNSWERMTEEYNMLSLFPSGHIMARMRPRLRNDLQTSKDVPALGDRAKVITAGLVVRRQRPRGKVVFITLEDEFGHIPLMIFPQVYEQYESRFRLPFLVVEGNLSLKEGAHNIVVNKVQAFSALEKVPTSKDWH